MIAKGDINPKTLVGHTARGKRVFDTGIYGKDVADITQSKWNLNRDISGRYAGTRDEADINIVTSEGNSLFRLDTAPYLNPMETLRMSTMNMIDTRVMNDYRLMTSQNFIREFSHILDGDLRNPVATLMDPKFKSQADMKQVAAAKNVSRAFNHLMNQGTWLDKKIESLKDQLIGSISPKLVPSAERMLPSVRDPSSFLRGAAFHMKMGFFQVQQVFIQANSLVNINAIAGQAGVRGTALYPLTRAALLSPNKAVAERAGGIAQSVGLMSKKDFVDSIRAYKDSGWDIIGKDVAYLDDLAGPEIRQGKLSFGFGILKSSGTQPFKEGERLVRASARS
jgi:hypothetical protein